MNFEAPCWGYQFLFEVNSSWISNAFYYVLHGIFRNCQPFFIKPPGIPRFSSIFCIYPWISINFLLFSLERKSIPNPQQGVLIFFSGNKNPILKLNPFFFSFLLSFISISLIQLLTFYFQSGQNPLVRVWDLNENLVQVAELRGHKSGITAVVSCFIWKKDFCQFLQLKFHQFWTFWIYPQLRKMLMLSGTRWFSVPGTWFNKKLFMCTEILTQILDLDPKVDLLYFANFLKNQLSSWCIKLFILKIFDIFRKHFSIYWTSENLIYFLCFKNSFKNIFKIL